MNGAGTGALEGVRVLDLIDGPGAYGSRLLAGLGADVVRVEHPSGSAHRRRPAQWTPLVRDTESGLYFVHYNAGKRGMTLDIEHPQGHALLLRLLDTVDIVFDNGQLYRMDIDLDDVAEGESPTVVVSVTPFGLDAPRSHWLGSDLICQAMSGMLGIYGYRGETPARFGPEQASEMAGLAAAYGALIALHGMRANGNGDFVDIAMERVASLTTFQMWNASLYHQFGFKRGRNERGEGLPVGLYEAADGYMAFNAWRDPAATVPFLVSAGASGELATLFASMPVAEFTVDPRVAAIVEEFVRSHTRAVLTPAMQEAGLMALPVQDAADLLADPFLESRAFFVDIDVPGFESPLRDAGAPMRLGATPMRPGRRPPLLGEHNDEVLKAAGVQEDELRELSTEGVI